MVPLFMLLSYLLSYEIVEFVKIVIFKRVGIFPFGLTLCLR